MQIDFAKSGGLVPAVVQDAGTGAVLMLGYMNAEALERTRTEGVVTFFSRSKGRLWTKGETSGNRLLVVEVRTDCDEDAILVRANPEGPTCHTGTRSCFVAPTGEVLERLELVIAGRRGAPPESSYTARLLAEGLPRIAQKVGEEATETVVAALAEDDGKLAGEAADLVYHLLVLLQARGLGLRNVVEVLEARHRPQPAAVPAT